MGLTGSVRTLHELQPWLHRPLAALGRWGSAAGAGGARVFDVRTLRRTTVAHARRYRSCFVHWGAVVLEQEGAGSKAVPTKSGAWN